MYGQDLILSYPIGRLRQTPVITKSVRCFAAKQHISTKQTHQIHRPDNRHRVRQQVAPADLIEAAQMREAGRPDLAPVRPLAAVADDEDAHFALGRLDGAVRFPRRDGVALCEEEEVVDEGLHVLLHGGAGRGRDLIVLDADGAGGHLVEALVDDAEGLAELLHAAEVAVVAVAVDADGHVKLDPVVRVVRLALAHVPGDAAPAEHDAREGVVEGVGGGDDADALGPAFPDAVVGEEFFGFVDAVAELGGPLVDVIEEAEGEVLVDAAGADIGCVKPGARDSLVEFLSLY